MEEDFATISAAVYICYAECQRTVTQCMRALRRSQLVAWSYTILSTYYGRLTT
jgi:hypothetical protein